MAINILLFHFLTSRMTIVIGPYVISIKSDRFRKVKIFDSKITITLMTNTKINSRVKGIEKIPFEANFLYPFITF